MRRYRGDPRDQHGTGKAPSTQDFSGEPQLTADAAYVPHARGNMRRYRGQLEEDDGPMNREQDGVREAARPARTTPISIDIVAAALGVVGATMVALKLAKYSLVGGSWYSPGAAAVVSEEVALIVALFLLRYAMRWGLRRLPWWESMKAGFPLAVKVLLWVSLVSTTIFVLVFLSIEHLYFCSTRSLLDSDAVVVAKKSFGPIVFIALQVEGARSKRVVLKWAVVVIPAGAIAYRLRRACAAGGGMAYQCGHKITGRWWRTASALTGFCLPSCGKPTTKSSPFLAAVSKVPVVVMTFASFVFISAALGPGIFPSGSDDGRIQLLRRNCFVRIALGFRSTPSSKDTNHWGSSVSAALSLRIVGGIHIDDEGAAAMRNHPELAHAVKRAKKKNNEVAEGASGVLINGTKRPNVVVVVLESTTGTLVTPSDPALVSPWVKALSRRGMTTSKFYSSMPNTNKAMFQVMCGMTPSLETAWVEFERPDVLEAACLPGLLRSKLGYRSLLLTGSMVGGLGVFAHDESIGFAGEAVQGGRDAFKARKVNDKFTFEHGTFEKVNYLGYDDNVVLNRSISFLLDGGGADDEDHGVGGGGKLLTILTVGPHHYHGVPSDFDPYDFGLWGAAKDVESLQYKYLVALRYQDLFLERLYKELDDTGLSKNTYVVIVGDHGEAFGEHGFDKHGNNIYEEGIIVPFSLTGPPGDPRITPGKTLNRVGMHADIVPTLLDLLGLWKLENVTHPRPQEQGAEALLDELQHKQEQEQERKNVLQEGGGDSPARGQRVRGGGDASREGAATTLSPAPGSGLIGDSLLGPDHRGCAVSATHYGAKALAVMAGDWKGLFLYRWKKQGDFTRAEIERAHLFDLSADPREEVNLVEGTGAKGCCPRAAETAPSTSGAAVREGELPASCFEAAQYPASLLKGGGSAGKASLDRATVLTTAVCCHLQTAAVVFARKNMEFFGR